MKFRNPETREVYDFTYKDCVSSGFCKKYGTCFHCPIYEKVDDDTCSPWVLSHPYEAARLMGYEVVEDEQFREATKKDEVNMGKPRICEVLGVEVGERFELGNTGIILLVNDDGLLHIGLSHGNHKETDMNVNYLVKAINDPDRIIRKPRFTEQEVEMAKNLLDVVGPAELRKVADMVTMKVDGKIIYLRKDAFPSLKNEMTVTLNEIIGGAE